jgi:hypothetical protein
MKICNTERGLKLAALAFVALPLSIRFAQADIIVNQFDTAAEVGQWRFDFSSVAHTAVFDSTRDANNNPSSGSMRVDLTFNSSLGVNNQGAYTTDRWYPGLDGSTLGTLQFDLRIDPDSAYDFYGNNGYFVMAIRNTDNYNYIQQFGDNVRIDAGWRHVSVPLTGPYDHIRALTFNLYGGPNQNIDGDVIFNIDNIKFTEVPEPSTLALLGIGALAATLIRRSRQN